MYLEKYLMTNDWPVPIIKVNWVYRCTLPWISPSLNWTEPQANSKAAGEGVSGIMFESIYIHQQNSPNCYDMKGFHAREKPVPENWL